MKKREKMVKRRMEGKSVDQKHGNRREEGEKRKIGENRRRERLEGW